MEQFGAISPPKNENRASFENVAPKILMIFFLFLLSFPWTSALPFRLSPQTAVLDTPPTWTDVSLHQLQVFPSLRKKSLLVN